MTDSAKTPDSPQPKPWSLRPARLGLRGILYLGAGSVIASFYIGTGDISIATTMGAKFGYRLWWTYFVIGIAAWALIDMSVRYYLQFNRTPMSLFKDVHPIFVVYMFLAIVVCTIFGSYNQWAACAMVLSGLFPNLSIEVSGTIAAGTALIFLLTGAYVRVERLFVIGLLTLIFCFFGSALMAGIDWRAAAAGLVPHVPGREEFSLFMSNAGSLINAWLILIYPYTMIERGLFSGSTQGKVDILHRSRVDYAWGILAAGLIALPVMAAAASVARPFGIMPRSYMDLSILLEPFAGTWSMYLFLWGLFIAAWTSGVGWWMCGCYALLDMFNMPIKLDTKPMRMLLALFAIPSTALLLLRVNPVYQMLIFSAFLAVVFPVIGLVMLYRITRPDMGYFRWTLRNPRGFIIAAIDIFAILLSLYIGFRDIGALFRH